MSPSLGSSTKKRRLDGSFGLEGAIKAARLTEKAIVNGKITLSNLTTIERVTVLKDLGDHPSLNDPLGEIFATARQLKAGGKFPDKGGFISTASSTTSTADNAFPVADTSKLYVRRIYKELYKEITEYFLQPPAYRTQNRFVVTGTSGIGKSVFLVYLALRLLAEFDDPPLIVFHIKTVRRINCYAFVGTSVFRAGTIDDSLQKNFDKDSAQNPNSRIPRQNNRRGNASHALALNNGNQRNASHALVLNNENQHGFFFVENQRENLSSLILRRNTRTGERRPCAGS